jgi:uncharacterized protein
MQRIDGRFVYSASDLNNFLECRRLTGLSREVTLGLREQADDEDETRKLIAHKGDEHERSYLERQKMTYGENLIAFNGRAQNTFADLRAAEEATVEAMRAGVHLIYQATFFDGTFLGRADFLRRVEVPSDLGDWSYEVIDTKLALSTKTYFLIQICNYSEHLARIQGVLPENGYIVLGSGEERKYRLNDYMAYYRHLKASFLEYVETELARPDARLPYPIECKHCDTCVWQPSCEAKRDADDHLSIVAFMRRDQIKKFEGAGIRTVAQLADATEAPYKMPDKTFDNLRAQAQQQHLQREAFRKGSEPKHFAEFRPFDPQTGFARLPKPSDGDIFFDMEGDPLYRSDRGLEYLWGYYLPLEGQYHDIWATDPNDERRAFEQFVDAVMARLQDYPDLHIYHYGSYEPTRMKRLMGIYGTRENEVNTLLRRGVFCDLYEVVRQGLWISQPSYSIKKLEVFYNFRRTAKTKRGDDSILMFESWLTTRDQSILDDIRDYNDEDCRSTHALRDWLLQQRATLEVQLGQHIPWAMPPESAEKPGEDEISETERRLLDGIPAPASVEELRTWTEDLRARWLLGNLQRYHRREQRPEWWKYFERIGNIEALEEFDSEAIGGLRWRSDIAPIFNNGARTPIYTFEFPPQEYNLGNKPFDPDSEKGAGTIVDLLHTQNLLKLKLNGKLVPEQLRALIPGTPIPDNKKRKAIEEIGNLYLAGELDSRYPALTDILLVRKPRLLPRDGDVTLCHGEDSQCHGELVEPRPNPVEGTIQPDEVTKESVSTIIQRLDRSYLFAQGPPGSGKSTTAAWAIVDLLERGKRVGIAALSHKAVHNLLRKVEETAHERGVHFRGCHKESELTEGSSYEPHEQWAMIESVDDIAELASPECRLAAGTTYAWADEALVDQFDYLFIDEAGQVCLADALVAARAADNVVLLGDPMQLPHVSKGSHPAGVSLSVLDHLRGDARTVHPEYGVFLDHSYRMHPQICAFISEAIYEGRLQSIDATKTNRVDSPGLSGAGLVYIPIEHEGNRNRSEEEAQRIVAEVTKLLIGTVTTKDRAPRPMTQADILVVAPYNLQRIRITQLLKDAGYGDVRVGTVDKFQGQEAAVVFYSMAATSAEHVPRGMDFLFDRNRFNVAISRAECMSVLLCSPALLETRCTLPEQMSLVNLICRYSEMSRAQYQHSS